MRPEKKVKKRWGKGGEKRGGKKKEESSNVRDDSDINIFDGIHYNIQRLYINISYQQEPQYVGMCWLRLGDAYLEKIKVFSNLKESVHA